jgi:uncharacterized protein (DUF58 family)
MIRRLHSLYRFTENFKKGFAARFTPSGKHFLIVVCIAFFFGLNIQRTMIYQIFTLFFGLLLFSFLSSLRFTSGLKVTRSLPGTCVAGKELKYKFQVENHGGQTGRGILYRESCDQPLPDWAEFSSSKEEGEDRRNIFDRKMRYYRWLWLLRLGRRLESSDLALPQVSAGKKTEVETSLLPLQRGNVHLDGYILTRLDPFGLCKRQVFHSEPHNLLVLPKLYTMPTLFFDGSRKYHQGGITAALEHGGSNDFISLREYVHGDPVKHIDWKSTARVGRTIVKQYRDEYFSRYGLVLDSFTPKRYSNVFEEAVSIAASVLAAENSEQSVLDLLFVGSECVTCSMGRGLGDKKQMMEILASVTTCRDKGFVELADLVKSHAVLLSGVVIILIDLDEQRQDLINHLAGLQIPVKAVLIVEDRSAYESKKGQVQLNVPLSIIDYRHVEEQAAQI